MGVAVYVGKGVNIGVGILVLVAKTDIAEEGVAKPSFDGEQLETTNKISTKFRKRTALYIFIIISETALNSTIFIHRTEETAQRLALPAGGRDETAPLSRNQLQATKTAQKR